MSSFSNGKTNPKDYFIGRGRLFMSAVDSVGFPVGGYRDLGNVKAFTFNVESEELEHRSSRSGLKTIDAKVTISQDMNFSLTLDEVNLNNLALFLSGETATRAQGALSITGDKNVAVADRDAWYDLYDVDDMSSGGYPQGNRAYSVSAVTVTSDDGVTTYVEGTDYELDLVMGRVFILSSGSIPAGTIGAPTLLDVEFTGAAVTLEQVRGLTDSEIAGAFKFISENPNDNGKLTEYQIHSASLSPDGDLALISDEFTEMGFSGSAEKREAVDPNSPVMTVSTYDQ